MFANPLHPYTKALLSAIPVPQLLPRDQRRKNIIRGEITNPIEPPPGCRFASRCPLAKEGCAGELTLREMSAGHFVSCAFAEGGVL